MQKLSRLMQTVKGRLNNLIQITKVSIRALNESINSNKISSSQYKFSKTTSKHSKSSLLISH